MDNLHEENYSAYIRSLCHDKITGVLNPDEKAFLDEQLEENPKALEIWNCVVEKYNSKDAQDFFNNPLSSMPSERLNQLFNTPRHPKGRRGIMVGLLSTAVLTVFGFFVFMLIRSRSTHDKPFGDQISLLTAEGKVISLQGNKHFVTSNVTVSAQDSAMTFSGGENATAAATNTLTVPAGHDYKITLSDGTLVWLNSASKLEFPFKFTGKREIAITGEAYLEVAQNAQSPFTLRLPGGRIIQVLGTSFNVNAYEAKEARISLVSGSVRVLSGEDSMMLKPGYQAVSKEDGIEEIKFNATDELAWREGKFFFNAMPLSEVVKVLSRWYGLTVLIDNPEKANRGFTGSLDRSKPIDEFLENAADIIEISYYKKEGVLHIK